MYTHTYIHTYIHAWKHSSSKYIPNRRSTLRVHLKLVSVFVSPTESTVQRLSLLCLRGLKSRVRRALHGHWGGEGGGGSRRSGRRGHTELLSLTRPADVRCHYPHSHLWKGRRWQLTVGNHSLAKIARDEAKRNSEGDGTEELNKTAMQTTSGTARITNAGLLKRDKQKLGLYGGADRFCSGI